MTVVLEPTTYIDPCMYVYSHPQPPAHNDIHTNGNRFRQHECLTVSTKY